MITDEQIEKARIALQSISVNYNIDAINKAANHLPDIAVEIGKELNMKRKEYSHRKSWLGCFVLMVREQYFDVNMQHWEWGTWRDADTQDLIEYHMRMYAKE